MAGRSYWLEHFTVVTWQEFLDAGARASGFREFEVEHSSEGQTRRLFSPLRYRHFEQI